MKLAYSTNGFTRVDLPAALRRIGAHGYAGAEILADAPHWRPGDDVEPIRAALADTGLHVSNVNANTAVCLWDHPPPEQVFEPSLSNSDPAVRRRRLDFTFAALDLAAAVGAPCVSVASGRTQAHVPPSEGFRWFADSLAVVCERAATLGVRVGIEYEPAILVESAHEAAAVIDRVGHPALGVNLDVGHAVCAGEDPVTSIERLGRHIWNVHLEDIRGRKHHHLVPGEGDVDFDGVFAALRRVGYDGFLTVELYTCADRAEDAARRALAHLAPRLGAARSERPAAVPPIP